MRQKQKFTFTTLQFWLERSSQAWLVTIWLWKYYTIFALILGVSNYTINLWRADSGWIPRSEGLHLSNLGILIILLDLHQVQLASTASAFAVC